MAEAWLKRTLTRVLGAIAHTAPAPL